MDELTYGSSFSGCGGFDKGFDDAGLKCAFQIEIDPWCNFVLRRHWPSVIKFEDIRNVRTEQLPNVDVFIGGSPCQGLSVAGLRKGLADDRSNLWYEYHRLVTGLKPMWFVFENVPGLFSSGPPYPDNPDEIRKGLDFAIILAGLTGRIPTIPQGGWKNSGFMQGQPGRYHVAWRVLDSQYAGVPQRRRRVFVVGCLAGTGRNPAEILFEPESSPWDTPPSREAGQGFAAAITERTSRADGRNLEMQEDVAYALTNPGSGGRPHSKLIVLNDQGGSRLDLEQSEVSPTLRSEAHGNVPIAFNYQSSGKTAHNVEIDKTGALQASQGMAIAFGGNNTSGPIDVATACNAHGSRRYDFESETFGNECLTPWDAQSKRIHSTNGTAPTVAGSDGNGGQRMPYLAIAPTLSTKNEVASSSTQRQKWYEQSAQMLGAVRRLTPVECERLQGLPDDWTAWGINEAGQRVEVSDTQRYKMLGNAVTKNVAEWIGRRIERFEKVCSDKQREASKR